MLLKKLKQYLVSSPVVVEQDTRQVNMVEEQITETETMDPGPMGDASNNLISYDQLRARLPAEITDDIVELMTNSAEALEDFAMISTQADVDQFNRKYSVNLVLPAEA